MVRAKFLCTEKIPSVSGDGYTISLQTVYSNSPINASFFKWTPFGQLQMGTVNPDAAAEFEVGKEYYVDFTKTN